MNAKNYEVIVQNPFDEIQEVQAGDNLTIPMPPRYMSDDLFFKVNHKNSKEGEKIICRLGINTSFLSFHNKSQTYYSKNNIYQLDPDSLKKQMAEYKDFKLKLYFKPVCDSKQCLDSADPYTCITCLQVLKGKQEVWKGMLQLVE